MPSLFATPLSNALQGNEKALVEITNKIQYHRLTQDEEKEILYGNKTKNTYRLYLQACLYGFGTQTIKEDFNKTKEIVNDLITQNAPSVSWALNLGWLLSSNFPDKYPIKEGEDSLVYLKRACMLNNPLALLNMAEVLYNKDQWGKLNDFLMLAAKNYDRFPQEAKDSLDKVINFMAAKPDLDQNKDVYLLLGKFYKEIKRPEEAYAYFLKDSVVNSIEAFTQCQAYINEAKPDKIKELITKRREQITNILSELSETMDPDMGVDNLKMMTSRFRFIIDEIKCESMYIDGKFKSNPSSKDGKLMILFEQLKRSIEKVTTKLTERDKLTTALDSTSSMKLSIRP